MPKEIKVGYLKVKVGLFVPTRCDVLTATSFATQASVARQQPNVNGMGKINIKSSVMDPRYALNCNGPHAASAKECPVWKKKKEIQRIRVEKRISFSEARQLVAAKFPSTTLTSALSFGDALNRKRSVKTHTVYTHTSRGHTHRTHTPRAHTAHSQTL